MASHANTPASVLNAPTSQPVLISEQSGTPRRERRRTLVFVDKSGDVDQVRTIPVRGFVPKPQQLPASNVPFTGKVSDAYAELVESLATETVNRATLLTRMKSLVTFGGGRSKKEPAPAESFKGRRIIGRGRAGSR